MSKSRTATWLGIAFVAAAFVVAIVAYPTIPDQMAIRWWYDLNLSLHVDYAPKEFGLFVAPAFSAVLFAAFRFGPDLVGSGVADDTIRHVFTYLATGLSGLLLAVELALVWLN